MDFQKKNWFPHESITTFWDNDRFYALVGMIIWKVWQSSVTGYSIELRLENNVDGEGMSFCRDEGNAEARANDTVVLPVMIHQHTPRGRRGQPLFARCCDVSACCFYRKVWILSPFNHLWDPVLTKYALCILWNVICELLTFKDSSVADEVEFLFEATSSVAGVHHGVSFWICSPFAVRPSWKSSFLEVFGSQ